MDDGSRLPESDRVRRLSPLELAAYDHVPLEVAERVRVVRVPVLAAGADAMTFGALVLVRHEGMADRTGRRELLAHELVHVRQWSELGGARFLWRYLTAYARNLRRFRSHAAAYRAIPLEMEAYAEAQVWSARRAGAGA